MALALVRQIHEVHPMFFKRRRRHRLRAQGLSESERRVLSARMEAYRTLSAADRAELDGHVRVFLAEKYFEGCNGMAITEEVRLLIAAQACMLLLHRETDYFPGMRSVLVYPGPFVGAGKATGPGGMVTESRGWRAGESWHTPAAGGPVVLSWPDVVAGAADARDGRNVVYHEFAHQLDGESGWVEGAPLLESAEEAAKWRRVMTEQFEAHNRAIWAGLPTVIGPYGATSPAEFFAVATEQFFERGDALHAANPGVYELLASYYRQNPARLACVKDARCGAA